MILACRFLCWAFVCYFADVRKKVFSFFCFSFCRPDSRFFGDILCIGFFSFSFFRYKSARVSDLLFFFFGHFLRFHLSKCFPLISFFGTLLSNAKFIMLVLNNSAVSPRSISLCFLMQ